MGLTYNLKQDCPRSEAEDAAAECEEKETVESIVQALRSGGHTVKEFPYGSGLLRQLEEERPDIVFNVAEGWSGRNREALVPAILEFLGIPYTGSDPLTLGLALDKVAAKRIVLAGGVPTPRFFEVTSLEDLAALERAGLCYPLFAKPAWEGSSKGVRGRSLLETPAALKAQVEWLLRTYRQPVLVEEFLPGREFSVGLLGNGELTVFPIIEVLPGEELAQELGGRNFVYSYEVKSGNRERFCCPAPLTEKEKEEVIAVAVRSYRLLGCRDLARIDLRCDAAGKPHFLEANPLPGLSKVSLFPLQVMAAGLSFEELINAILEVALERYGLG